MGSSVQIQPLLKRHNWSLDNHDAFLWIFPFLFKQGPTTSSLSVCGCFFCFVFFPEIWIWILLDVAYPLQFPQTHTTPSSLADQLLSPVSYLSGHCSHNIINIPNVQWVTTAAAPVQYAMVGLIQKASRGYYWEGIRTSSTSCLILKLTSIYQASPECLKPGAVLNNTGES